ncbi:uncharacterized protein LOC113067232, partial [Tachysurus ichikawai]
MSMEAEISCNPVTSFSALRASDPASVKRNPMDSKRNKANVFHVQIATENNQNDEKEQRSTKGNPKVCLFCKESKHKIYNCPKFTAKSLEDKRQYVRDNKLCYGCMKLVTAQEIAVTVYPVTFVDVDIQHAYTMKTTQGKSTLHQSQTKTQR